MIAKETITIDGREFQRTASDAYMIRKVGTGEVYSEAVDPPTSTWAYEETDIVLDNDTGDKGESNAPNIFIPV